MGSVASLFAAVFGGRRPALASSGAGQFEVTKTDKIKEAGVPRLVSETMEKIRKRPAAFPEVLATSSEKGAGLDTLRAAIMTAIAR